MRTSESLFLPIRELRYHVRRWSRPGAPKMVLLHGWMDVSASFQFMVDALKADWDVYAPDWRGYGLTEWGKGDCYWFADYIADLDFLLQGISEAPVNLVGHSLGGNVAALYAGTRPERIAKLVNLEGFGLRATRPEQAPERYKEWLEELRTPPQLRAYANFDELAGRLRKGNQRLSAERADFLARHWGHEKDGKVVLRADPAHKIVNATLYRYEEAVACWQRVTAPVLWVEGDEWDTLKRYGPDASQLVERRAAFPNLQHVSIPQSGHMLHHDQPEALARAIEAFLG
ncbi:MAG TPA: alpha/beta hydrolase [Burkholderiales bacterium]|nr:alpha/beta hydrolase [Burkholderiales bacterium]